MAIPSNVPNTAAGYIEYLADNITLADKLWTHFGWATSNAYASAYKQNQQTLNLVKKKQEERKAQREALYSFALSLLTVGVAGGIAGAVARKFAAKYYASSKVAEDVAKDVLKWSSQKAAAPLNQSLSEALSPDVSSKDVFSAGDTTPEEYTTSLQEGITHNVALLQKILFETKWDSAKKSTAVEGKVIDLRSGGQLTADGAKLLTEAILATSFMSDMPPLDVDVGTLTRKASLALWIGWALARDAKYWNVKDAPIVNQRYDIGRGWVNLPVGPAFFEQLEWEPVRQAIIRVGVLPQAVTMQSNMPVGQGRVQSQTGLYMRGFMEWSASPQALWALFDNSLPKNKLGFEMVQKAQSRRLLTPTGWTGTGTFTPLMSPQ
jgi:hypothetical protein